MKMLILIAAMLVPAFAFADRHAESVKNIFVKAKQQDFWETMSEKQKQEIDKGLAEIVSEDTVEYESVMKKHRK